MLVTQMCFYRQRAPWHNCLMRQADGANLISYDEGSLKKLKNERRKKRILKTFLNTHSAITFPLKVSKTILKN